MNNLRNNSWRTRELLRYPNLGVISGVCAGIGAYTGVAAVWIRIAAVTALFVFNGLALFAYIALAVVLKKAPGSEKPSCKKKAEKASSTDYEQTATQASASDGPFYSRSAEAARQRMADIDARLANVERYVTSNRFRLQQEFDQLK